MRRALVVLRSYPWTFRYLKRWHPETVTLGARFRYVRSALRRRNRDSTPKEQA